MLLYQPKTDFFFRDDPSKTLTVFAPPFCGKTCFAATDVNVVDADSLAVSARTAYSYWKQIREMVSDGSVVMSSRFAKKADVRMYPFSALFVASIGGLLNRNLLLEHALCVLSPLPFYVISNFGGLVVPDVTRLSVFFSSYLVASTPYINKGERYKALFDGLERSNVEISFILEEAYEKLKQFGG